MTTLKIVKLKPKMKSIQVKAFFYVLEFSKGKLYCPRCKSKEDLKNEENLGKQIFYCEKCKIHCCNVCFQVLVGDAIIEHCSNECIRIKVFI